MFAVQAAGVKPEHVLLGTALKGDGVFVAAGVFADSTWQVFQIGLGLLGKRAPGAGIGVWCMGPWGQATFERLQGLEADIGA